MEYKDVKNIRSANKDFYIDCDVVFPGISSSPVPFTAKPDDTSGYGQEIYKRAIAGEFGDVSMPPVEVGYYWNGTGWAKNALGEIDSVIYDAEIKKKTLIDIATQKINILSDALELDMATEDEKKQLIAWKKHRVQLSRIDTNEAPNIDWPII
ncbi:tail fiber assembly protein [uncultured Serratia sp.]|uniref:tail fiber assembly protein n=1 Tax=uncultured Serratia sp. TaxID=239175 RepID=UPI002586BF2B|nr:tail fiber assembly protein [uncultured Serratia sp.]